MDIVTDTDTANSNSQY